MKIDKTTLGYIVKEDKVLMLYRNKKENDINQGKWVGIGGHLEKDETPFACIIRETKEETGLNVKRLIHRGEILFSSDEYEEIMYLYLIDEFDGELIACNEGELKWIDIKNLLSLNMWEGDKIFLPLLFNSNEFIKLHLVYEDNKLVKWHKI